MGVGMNLRFLHCGAITYIRKVAILREIVGIQPAGNKRILSVGIGLKSSHFPAQFDHVCVFFISCDKTDFSIPTVFRLFH